MRWATRSSTWKRCGQLLDAAARLHAACLCCPLSRLWLPQPTARLIPTRSSSSSPSTTQVEASIEQYRKAVELQPGYVTGAHAAHAVAPLRRPPPLACRLPHRATSRRRTPHAPPAAHPALSVALLVLAPSSLSAAWNNLGDAYEKRKQYGPALAAYREALTYAPDNKVGVLKSAERRGGGGCGRGQLCQGRQQGGTVLCKAPPPAAVTSGDAFQRLPTDLAWPSSPPPHAAQSLPQVAQARSDYCKTRLDRSA